MVLQYEKDTTDSQSRLGKMLKTKQNTENTIVGMDEKIQNLNREFYFRKEMRRTFQN